MKVSTKYDPVSGKLPEYSQGTAPEANKGIQPVSGEIPIDKGMKESNENKQFTVSKAPPKYPVTK